MAKVDRGEAPQPTREILTVGHSTLSYDDFLKILQENGVNAIADVRSAPYSKRFPHFSRSELKGRLKADSVAYVFLGKELGGRPDSPSLFTHGVADYEKMASRPEFHRGLDRLVEGAGRHRIAVMCSERSPFDCHRCLLVGRALKRRGIRVCHILGNGQNLDQDGIEAKLLEMNNQEHADFFIAAEQRLDDAYRDRSHKVAFEEIIDDDFSNGMEHIAP